MPEAENLRDAMIRWQASSREQRSAVNSLFLTYAAALIGLLASILLNKDIEHIYHCCLFMATGTAVLVSLISGCAIALLRLSDARLTARIARYKFEQRPESEIQPMQASTKKLGPWIKNMIPVQVGSFVLAAIAFLAWILANFGSKFA